MDNTPEHLHDEPTVNDLRVKLCYICREEERHDSPPHPPTVWLHPCKCTLVAHESCLLHWIKTQQRDFGRSRGELKCPQCGDPYEFEGFNPRILRILNSVNRTLSRSGRIVIASCVGTAILSSGAGIYLTCATYGAFAVREFVGPDIFRTLLTSNPTNWPLHAWFYLPLIPFSLIVSRTPLIIWTTSPLVPLLFPWPSTLPVSAAARGGSSRVQLGLWPPPPALVCALFPIVRVLYGRLRNRIIQMMVRDIIQTEPQVAQQLLQQRRAQQGIQEQRPGGNPREHLQRLRIHLRAQRQRAQQQPQPQQRQPQQQEQNLHQGPGAGRHFRFQVGQLFGFEIAHFIFDRNPPPPRGVFGPAAGPAPPVAVVDDAANGGDGRAVDNPADQQHQRPHQDGPVQEPGQGPPALAPADQDPQQQEQQDQQPPLEPQQQQRAGAEQGQGEGQEPVPPAGDEEDVGAVAAHAIRVTGASLGRLIAGALLMPSIARVMGSVLLHISHVVPLMRTIIAPLPPPLPPLPSMPQSGPISTLIRFIRGAPADTVRVGYHGYVQSGSGLGSLFLRGFLATSREWASSDPIWWRNTLGLGIFLVVKDGLKILHLWLAKRELEERHLKNKSFAGIDLADLDLIDRHKPEEA